MTETLEPLLIFVRDLLFSSRIVSGAKEHAIPFRVVRDASILSTLGGRALIVDLNQERFLEAAKEWKQRVGKTVVGFSSHVDIDTISAAKAAAFERVMTRGQFTASLNEVLGDIAAAQT